MLEYIYMAASNNVEEMKRRADYVCMGNNDQPVICTDSESKTWINTMGDKCR